MAPQESKLRPLRVLQAPHGKDTEEQDTDNTVGSQGGQQWEPPTASPSATPTTLSPTVSPTSRPTVHGDPFLLKGVTFYDRNANSERDSNVVVMDMGQDVEYSHGLGGVAITLVQCDPETNEELIDKENNSYASAMTQGFDVTGTPMLTNIEGAGRYTLTNIKINRSYFIRAKAPEGFLLTAGACDEANKVKGWECNPNAVTEGDDEDEEDTEGATPLGLREGRSSRCVNVDVQGIPDGTLDLGVMRVGDSKEVKAKVALKMDFASTQRGRALMERVLRGVADGTVAKIDGQNGRVRYLLGDEDKAAIGGVTAEVIAGTLDGVLRANGVELDHVLPKDVMLEVKDGESDTVAVAMEIKGHYSPPPDLDFDYIVQDSINSDSEVIRRGLQEYNQNCRDQTSKVLEQGLVESDFEEVHSVAGARPNRGKGSSGGTTSGAVSTGGIYRTACAQGNALPDYFETSLLEVAAKEVSAINFNPIESIIYVSEESRFESWAMGPVAAVSGLIALLLGAFVFRRAVGPRRVDKYREGNTTKLLDEECRFGEAGGHMDDGSVDSAFYSDSDDDEDEQDKKMRRKRKEKDDMQKGKSSKKFKDVENKDKSSRRNKDTDRQGSSKRSKDLSSSKSTTGSDTSSDNNEATNDKKRRNGTRSKSSRSKADPRKTKSSKDVSSKSSRDVSSKSKRSCRSSSDSNIV